MSLVVGWLLSLGTLAPLPTPDSSAVAACAAFARASIETPTVAADVRATLVLHGAVVRWEPTHGPVRIWVQSRPMASVTWDHPASEWRSAVLDAAGAWRGTVPDLEFQPVRDSADADVVVTWEGSLSLAGTGASGLSWRTAGRTVLAAAENGGARAAHVRLAMVAPTGEAYEVSDVRAVARHELGHALGLAHHAAARSVMAALIRVDRLDAGDRAALRLLYALPAGARCAEAVAPPASQASAHVRR